MTSQVKRPLLSGIATALLAWTFATPAQAADSKPVRAPHLEVRWVAPERFGRTAEPIPLGIQFNPEPGWHLYWINPGDTGTAPKFRFSTEDATLGPVKWPFPERLPTGHLVNFGYSGETVFLTELSGIRPQAQNVRLKAKLEWLICREECIPGSATLDLTRPVGPTTIWEPALQGQLREARLLIPGPSQDSPWRARSARLLEKPEGKLLEITLEGPERGLAPELFPLNGEDGIGAGRPETTSAGPAAWTLRFAIAGSASLPERTHWVIADPREGRSWELSLTHPLQQTAIPMTSPTLSFWILLASAFFGGILLNLMPCVFPVLSIKVLSLLEARRNSDHHLFREGLWYSAGVLATFSALGALLLVLRQAGASIGWGFQLQSPPVILGLVLLFWLMALNFLGVFEMGGRLMMFAGKTGQNRSAFATGILSVFVAAPCTGPFMGTALGAAVTLPAWQSLGIFAGLGAGLAAPFLLLTASPALLSRLPKPGKWMETLKQFFAFPLLATVLWLLWVLGRQVGDPGWILGAALLLGTSFALWLGRSHRGAVQVLAWACGLAIVAFSWSEIRTLPRLSASSGTTKTQAPTSASPTWAAYDRTKIETLRSQGQAVFVDFTAAWCVSCQINKKVVLDTPEAAELFAHHQVALFQGDWTNEDPKITEALAEFNRNSVPLYLFYPAGGKPVRILPQLLTLGILNSTLTGKETP